MASSDDPWAGPPRRLAFHPPRKESCLTKLVRWGWGDTPQDVVVEDYPGCCLGAGPVAPIRAALGLLESRPVTWAEGMRTDGRVVIETPYALVADGLSPAGFTVYPVSLREADARRNPLRDPDGTVGYR